MSDKRTISRKGINYDVGTFTRGRDLSSRDVFEPAIVRREMEIIKYDLRCTAVRISGEDIGRLKLAAEYAREQGLEVWLSPAFVDADEQTTLYRLIECAKMAEELRSKSAAIILIIGCELTFFMKGLVDGETSFDRIQTFMKPWRLLKSTIRRGSFQKRLNAFLTKATAAVREHFHGPLTYASGTWEQVRWDAFDFVSVDYYRDTLNKKTYREKLKSYGKHGKPVIITEFGCCTYKGAEEKGGYGWAIVDRSKQPHRISGDFVRDEQEQVRYMGELLEIFAEERVEGAFWFTFVMATYPHHEEPVYDLDMASYGVVKVLADKNGETYPDMPWEPKQSFRALADHYAR